MTYKSTRRQWVKLWVNEWLDGTTRFELTAPQRLLWVDLLALAGRSRFPGFVYAGLTTDGKKMGYPIAYLAGVLQMDEVALNNALKLLQLHGHITIEESALEVYIIGIVNWEKYQSEYLRQKGYRKVTTQTTKRLPVEVEEEGEKKEKKIPVGPAAELVFWSGEILRITEKQHQKLWNVYGDALTGMYGEADLYLDSHREKKYKNHYAFMRNWMSRQVNPPPEISAKQQAAKVETEAGSFDKDNLERARRANERTAREFGLQE